MTIQRAAVRGDLEKIKELLAANAAPEDVRRALLAAAIRRRTEAVQLLRAANPPADIFTAAATGDLPALKRFIEQNSADANAHDKLIGRSVLCWAVRAGQKEAVEYLLGQKADANDRAKVDRFQSGIMTPVASEQTDKGEPIREVESPLWAALDDAVPIDPAVVHLLLEHGADANERGPSNTSPLARAASKGALSVIDDLVAHKARVKALEAGGTPLLVYALASREVTACLLKHGVDANSKLPSGSPVLDAAVDTPETGAADELIKGGAQVTFKAACVLGKTDDARAFIQRNPAIAVRDINTRTHEGPIFLAARFNQGEIARLLLSAGARVDAKNSDELQPVHVAATRGGNAALTVLLERGAKVDAESPLGRPINCAAAGNKAETVKLLLDRGAEVNAPSQVSKQTPLVSAAAADALEAAALLIARGADVNKAYAEFKQTPLHVAAYHASVKVVGLLLEKGANGAAVDAQKKTPLDLARAGSSFERRKDAARREEVVKLLTPPPGKATP
ncbi:MAG: ankyrin repeat domain-containing protein [Phycisphaerales bacterium]